MPKKLSYTPKSRVRAALRQLTLRSRERAAALKRDKYSCVHCGVKQSKARGKEQRVEVHHIDGIKWDDIFDYIYQHLLPPPEKWETVCPDCHREIENGQ